MITEITKKQEELIPQYIKKWVDLASEPINRKIAIKQAKKIFGDDKILIFGENLQNTIDLIKVATKGQKISMSDSQSHSQLRSWLNSQLYSQLFSQLRSWLNSQLYLQLFSQLYSQLFSQLNSQLNSQLYSQLSSQLDLTYNFYISYWWYSWVGYYEYVEKIGVKFDKEKLKDLKEIVLNMPICIFIGNVIFVVEKPKCRWNNNGFLHSDEFPAIEWKDKTGLYFLNGVKFEKELWEKVVSGKMPFEDILKIEDIDQRTQAMRYGDVNAFMKHTKGKVLDTYEKFTKNGDIITYRLYEIPQGDIFQKTAYFMTYNCPSTNKLYMSGVKPFKKVVEAMAWKARMTQEQWKLLVPLVNES